MEHSEAIKQYLAGLQNVERELIRKLRSEGVAIDAGHFRWNAGQDFTPPPEAISLEVSASGRRYSCVLSREQVEDCWERIDNTGVLVGFPRFPGHIQ